MRTRLMVVLFLVLCMVGVVTLLVQAPAVHAQQTHSVALSWTPSTSACVTTTNIHRTQTPGAAVIGTNFASIPTATTTWTDTSVVGGQTYFYSLSAFGGSCGGTTHESVLSPEFKAVVPPDCILPSTIVNGVCTPPPAPPSGLTGAIQ